MNSHNPNRYNSTLGSFKKNIATTELRLIGTIQIFSDENSLRQELLMAVRESRPSVAARSKILR
jgi:hypothetical protein